MGERDRDTESQGGDLHAYTGLGCLRVTGEDRVSFLQGQLSSDVAALHPGRACLTSINNRQGRAFTVATALVVDQAILLLMPVEQVEDSKSRLGMYVLRARVELHGAADSLPLSGTWDDDTGTLPTGEWEATRHRDGGCVLRMPGPRPRWLLIGSDRRTAPRTAWHFEDVLAGMPQVYRRTREAFLPQALNLDALGGISFEKGCYVGQEVIARLHFKGTVKRRMRLLRAAGVSPPEPGDALMHDGKSAGKVVDAAAHEGEMAVLAVFPVSAPTEGCMLADGTALETVDLPYTV